MDGRASMAALNKVSWPHDSNNMVSLAVAVHVQDIVVIGRSRVCASSRISLNSFAD